MNFKDFYNLKEYHDTYPLWYDLEDGGRIIYCVTVRNGGRVGCIQKLESTSKKYVDITETIDNETPSMDFWLMYSATSNTSFEKMLESVHTSAFWWGNEESDDDDSGLDHHTRKDNIADFKETIEPLRNVEGKWYVICEDEDDFTSLHVCVEVDPAYVRSYNINRHLKNSDTTGFEDIL